MTFNIKQAHKNSLLVEQDGQLISHTRTEVEAMLEAMNYAIFSPGTIVECEDYSGVIVDDIINVYLSPALPMITKSSVRVILLGSGTTAVWPKSDIKIR